VRERREMSQGPCTRFHTAQKAKGSGSDPAEGVDCHQRSLPPWRALSRFNGEPGVARSFDQLHAFLQQQHYRLAFWRLANQQINYRRFFDVSELVCLRMELREVFETTHRLVFTLIRDGRVTGLDRSCGWSLES
jgi:hypothetical protein